MSVLRVRLLDFSSECIQQQSTAELPKAHISVCLHDVLINPQDDEPQLHLRAEQHHCTKFNTLAPELLVKTGTLGFFIGFYCKDETTKRRK